MKEITIENFHQLDEVITRFGHSSLFRGVSDSTHKLIPSLFRHAALDSTDDAADTLENSMMWLFKTSAKAFIKKTPDSEVEWLVIGQHHGLPTRILDWSLSPLVACFFAVHSLSETDAAIYIYDPQEFHREENIILSDLNKIIAFIPSHASPRVTAQSGMFTLHPSNQVELNGDHITKIIIPKSIKKEMLRRLVKYGIHHGTIFPDLDGLSKYIKYLKGY
jgi:hypothetical protein